LEILKVLGEGGMGRVFMARQHSLNREVAVKTVRDQAPELYRTALLAEGAVTGLLEHPSIIPVHALGIHDDGRPVLVMKRVDGVAWDDLLRDPGHAAWEGWGGHAGDRLEGHLEILLHVCNAAHFAHSHGLVHRDIKPQNVLIGRFGEVYLADWGLARLAGPAPVNKICGTPGYMAPEMALGGPVDARTDVYLLGATLHELLTGRLRHQGADVAALMQNAVTSPPVDYAATVPSDLAALANWATCREPEGRPETAEVFRRAVADHLRHKTSTALTTSALPRLALLRELIQSPRPQAEDTHPLQDQLTTEIRFAVSQALETWPENPAAREALVELESLVTLRRTRAAELERLARDLDPAVSARHRNLAVAGLALAAVAVALPVVFHGVRYQASPRELLLASLVPLAMVILVTVVLRRPLAHSAVNRRSAVAMLIMVTAISLSRLLGFHIGSSAAAMLLHDCMIGAVLASFAAVTIFPWLKWVAGVMLLSAGVCALFPDFAFLAFSVATSASLLLGLYRATRG
jgi:serine/threonine-protein kinase